MEVFDVEFAYDNFETIKILIKRGTAITNLDWETVEACDQQLLDLITDYNIDESTGAEYGRYVDLTRPVCAFITFDSDDGKMVALKYSEESSWFSGSTKVTHETMFLTTPKFIQAVEPTNIIWENRHIKGINYGARVLGAVLIAIFMLTIAFFIIFGSKQAQIRSQKKWPVVDCDAIHKTYTNNTILQYAGVEYNDMKSSNGTLNMMGALKC